MMTHEDEQEETETTSFHQNPNSLTSFIEPSSYAEAVFKSFDLDSGENSGATSSPATVSDYLKVTVTDPKPKKETDIDIDTENNTSNNSTYTTYLITTRTNLKEFNGSEFSVRRRFSDFVKLSDRLSECYRGYFVPIRPDKRVIESKVMQKVKFVEMRKNGLERYLRKICDHSVIRNSEDLRVFLTVKGKMEWVKSESVIGKGELVRRFKELKQSVTYGWGGTKAPLVVEDDMEFLDKKRKLKEFEVVLGKAYVQAVSLVEAQQDTGETMGELGLAFVKLAKFETEEAMFVSQKTRAGDMKNVATSTINASRLYRELTAETFKHLDKLYDYVGVMLDVNSAYSDRSNALLTVQTLVSELTALNSRIKKLEAVAFKIFGEDRSRIQKLEELKETMRVTEDAKSHAVEEYERIKEINKTEFERIDKERHDDFIVMLRGFVVCQAGYAEKLANAWEKFANRTVGYAPKA